MARVVLVFASTHAAMAAEDALREVGIALQVISLPAWVAADCGLALRLDSTDAGRAKQELLRREIPVRGFHEEPPEAGPLGDSPERH
jgi:Protein of unknown function (DUF3343)